MQYRLKIIILFLISLVCFSNMVAQTINENGVEYPVPVGNDKQLFYLQRNENINTLIYELNEQNGVLNKENPIRVFWILYLKKEEHADLTEMEKKFAYGIKLKPSNTEALQFSIVSCPKINLQLIKDVDKKYHVSVILNKQTMILNRVFIKLKEGTFKIEPEIEYIEFTGVDLITRKEITEWVRL